MFAVHPSRLVSCGGSRPFLTKAVQRYSAITCAGILSNSQAQRRLSKMSSGYHFEVCGKVQGVFFRASAADEAKRLGIVGWVRNTEGGSVEGEAQGSSQQLETFRDWLTHKGSPGCRIDGCVITEEFHNLDQLGYTTFEDAGPAC